MSYVPASASSDGVLRPKPPDWENRLDGILEQVQQLRADMLASGQYPGEELAQALLLLQWAKATSPKGGTQASTIKL